MESDRDSGSDNGQFQPPTMFKANLYFPLHPKTGAFVGTMVQESVGQHHSLSSCFEQWTSRDVYLKTEVKRELEGVLCV